MRISNQTGGRGDPYLWLASSDARSPQNFALVNTLFNLGSQQSLCISLLDGHKGRARKDLHEILPRCTASEVFTLPLPNIQGTPKDSEPQFKEEAFVSLLLLICGNCLIGDAKAAVTEAQKALYIIRDLRGDHHIKDRVLQIFTRLVIQMSGCVTAFGFPQPDALHHTDRSSLRPTTASAIEKALAHMEPLELPARFYATEESARSFDILQVRMLDFIEALPPPYLTSMDYRRLAIVKSYALDFQNQISAWSSAHKFLCTNYKQSEVSAQEGAERSVLEMNKIMMTILFSAFFSGVEGYFDGFQVEFTEIVALAKEVLVAEEVSYDQGTRHTSGKQDRTADFKSRLRNPGALPPIANDEDSRQEPYEYTGASRRSVRIETSAGMSFTSGIGILYPLYVVATRCRNRGLRREAIKLLLSSHRREALWDSLLSAHVAMWVMGIEEEGLPAWESSGAAAHSVVESKRVVVTEVLYDLQKRTATCRYETKGVRYGEPNRRTRETTLRW